MLINTMTDKLINLDEVSCVETTSPDEGPRTKLVLKNGDCHFTKYDLLEVQNFANSTIVAAAPGYFALTYFKGATEPPFYTRHEVIAWQMTFDDHGLPPFPITAQNQLGYDDEYAIISPNGDITNFERTWPSIDDWVEDCRRLERRGA